MKGQGVGCGRILLGDNTGDGAVRLQPIDLESVVEFGLHLVSLLFVPVLHIHM